MMRLSNDISYVVSSRNILKRERDILSVISKKHDIPRDSIKSIFGFFDTFYKLYGGRIFTGGITNEQYHQLIDNGVEFELCLTNVHFSDDLFNDVVPLLDSLNPENVSIICSNDLLAKKLKSTYDFKLRKSIIMGVESIDDIEKALELYDTVTIPPSWNDDEELLQSIPQKERVTLFSMVGCLYNCKLQTCYKIVSDKHADIVGDHVKCDSEKIFTKFDITDKKFTGFTSFKIPI